MKTEVKEVVTLDRQQEQPIITLCPKCFNAEPRRLNVLLTDGEHNIRCSHCGLLTLEEICQTQG